MPKFISKIFSRLATSSMHIAYVVKPIKNPKSIENNTNIMWREKF